MFCPKCGGQVRDGATFCPTCGNTLAQPQTTKVAHQAAPVMQQVPPVAAQQSAQSLGTPMAPGGAMVNAATAPTNSYAGGSEAAGQRGASFSISLLLFWLKGGVEVDYHFIKTHIPNTVLGLFPAGANDWGIPLKNVSATVMQTSYRVLPMILGALIMFGSIPMLVDADTFLFALFLLLLGIVMIGSGFRTMLIIQRSGTDYTISAPFFEKGKLLEIKDAIDGGLSRDIDKTDLNRFFGSMR